MDGVRSTLPVMTTVSHDGVMVYDCAATAAFAAGDVAYCADANPMLIFKDRMRKDPPARAIEMPFDIADASTPVTTMTA